MTVHKLTAGDGYTYLTRQTCANDASQPAEYATHRGLLETEAESVAYVLAGLLGLDTTDYSIGYITSWTDGDTEIIKTTAANVLHAVHTLAPELTQRLDRATVGDFGQFPTIQRAGRDIDLHGRSRQHPAPAVDRTGLRR